MKYFMAIDQHGQHFDALKHPRKDLFSRLGRKHAARMYVDGKDGKAYHAGYIIAGLWLSVFSVTPMRKPV